MLCASRIHSWLFLMQNVPRPQSLTGILVKSLIFLSENVCFKMRNPTNPSEQKAKKLHFETSEVRGPQFCCRYTAICWITTSTFQLQETSLSNGTKGPFWRRPFCWVISIRWSSTCVTFLGVLFVIDFLKMLRGEKVKILLIVFWSPGWGILFNNANTFGLSISVCRGCMDEWCAWRHDLFHRLLIWYQDWFREFLWLSNDVKKFWFRAPGDFHENLCLKAKGKELTSIYDFFIGLGHRRGGGKGNHWVCVGALKTGLHLSCFLDGRGHQKYPKQRTFIAFLRSKFRFHWISFVFLWMILGRNPCTWRFSHLYRRSECQF